MRIPESGIGNPGLPFLVSFVLRNSKTNLKRFRKPDLERPGTASTDLFSPTGSGCQQWRLLIYNPGRERSAHPASRAPASRIISAMIMALVTTPNGAGWGALTTTGGARDAPLPTCLARLVQNKNGVRAPSPLHSARRSRPPGSWRPRSRVTLDAARWAGAGGCAAVPRQGVRQPGHARPCGQVCAWGPRALPPPAARACTRTRASPSAGSDARGKRACARASLRVCAHPCVCARHPCAPRASSSAG